MTPPSEQQIWIMGGVGLVALLSRMSLMGEDVEYSNTGNTLKIIVEVLSRLSLAPICLYFPRLYGSSNKAKTASWVKFYILFLMILGMATTRRMLIFNGVVTVAFIYLFLLLFQNKTFITTRNVIFFFFAFYLVTGPAADMAAAMILNRHADVSADKSLIAVWDLYKDKEKLHHMYQWSMAASDNEGNNEYSWSEYYVDNIFLDRFCNLRVMDATLYNAQKAGFGSKSGENYYENFWINEIPSPLANALNLKKNFQGTATDHMVIANFSENQYSLGGMKVGGETGIGLWMFGYWYYLIAFFTYIVVFYFLCSFVNIQNGILLLPLPILINFSRYWMFFLNANGIFSSMGYVFTRNNLNAILIYCVIFYILQSAFRWRK
jgi:hypothetical protein